MITCTSVALPLTVLALSPPVFGQSTTTVVIPVSAQPDVSQSPSPFNFSPFLPAPDLTIVESSFAGRFGLDAAGDFDPLGAGGGCGYVPESCGTTSAPYPVLWAPEIYLGGDDTGGEGDTQSGDVCGGSSTPYTFASSLSVDINTALNGQIQGRLPDLYLYTYFYGIECTNEFNSVGSASLSLLLEGNLTVTYIDEPRPFQRATLIDSALGQPWCVQTSDVDLDGDLDVLVAARSDDAIGWYQNDGTGQFGPWQAVTTEADGVFSFVPADLDGDGDDDILVASDEDDTLAWHENTGGAFGSRQLISTSVNGARSVVAADLDGDGALDAVVGSMNDDSVSWFRNLGGGAFGSRELITTTADFVLCVDAADMDGDGDMDVLSASRDDRTVAWYANDGTGGGWGRTLVSTDLDKPTFVRAADLDGDGDTDVVATSLEYGLVARFLNGGVGDFPADSAPVVGAGIQRASALALADMDLDGDMDVLTSSYGPTPSSSTPAAGKIAWFEAAEPGAFLPEKNLADGLERASFVHCADVTGDGRPDVLATSYVDGSLWLFDNRIPEFTDPVWIFEPSGEPIGQRWDMDGDGDYDILAAGECTENLGAGAFSSPVNVRIPGSTSSGQDLNGDGYLDWVSIRNVFNQGAPCMDVFTDMHLPHTLSEPPQVSEVYSECICIEGDPIGTWCGGQTLIVNHWWPCGSSSGCEFYADCSGTSGFEQIDIVWSSYERWVVETTDCNGKVSGPGWTTGPVGLVDLDGDADEDLLYTSLSEAGATQLRVSLNWTSAPRARPASALARAIAPPPCPTARASQAAPWPWVARWLRPMT